MNSPKYQRFISDFVKLILLVVVGTMGFMLVERWSFLDSLYMTVITLTTVGYGEVYPLDTNGKIYSIVLILVGAGVVLYILGDMVELLIDINLGGRMKYKIVKLTGHQIVCGFGRTGQEVCEHFKENKIPFIVIEQDPEVARHAEDLGMLVLQGDATTDETLLDSQITKADGIVCCLPDDTLNTFIALTAKGLKEDIDIVSRSANPGSEAKLKRAGVRMVISPYVICGKRLAASVTHPLVTQFLDFVIHTPAKDLRLEQIRVTAGAVIIGQTLKEANIKQASGSMILAVFQNGKLITNPSPDLIFAEGDELIALGAQQELNALSKLARK